MKRKVLKSLVITAILSAWIFGGLLNAQPNKRAENQEKIEAQKIAFITKELNLTPKESQEFWPIYNEFSAKKKELAKQYFDSRKTKKKDDDSITDAEAEAILEADLKHAQSMLDLRKEYLVKFKKVLPAKKVLELHESEREFRKILMKNVRNHKPCTPPQSPKE